MKCSNSLFNTAQMKCVAAFFQIKGESILIQMYSDFFWEGDCTQTSAVFGTQFVASIFFLASGSPRSILSFKPWGQWQLAISMLIYDLPKRRVLPDEAPCAIVGNELWDSVEQKLVMDNRNHKNELDMVKISTLIGSELLPCPKRFTEFHLSSTCSLCLCQQTLIGLVLFSSSQISKLIGILSKFSTSRRFIFAA